jgi:predicted GIY-YIG superfamily endonuclease
MYFKIKVAGVYKILHKNGSYYIGSSINITNRWASHINDLTKKLHHSLKFQDLWDISNVTDWTFQIVSKVSKTALKQHSKLKGKALDNLLRKEVLKEERLVMKNHKKLLALNTDVKHFTD